MPNARSLFLHVGACIGLCFASSTQATAQVLQWNLDGADTDVREEGSQTTGIARVLGSVARAVPPLAPGSGTAASFAAAPGGYIDAGTLRDDGQYVPATAPGTPLRLLSQWTVSAWFRAEEVAAGDYVIVSNDFTSTTGMDIGIRGGQLFCDFGSLRQAGPVVQANTTYFVAMVVDPNAVVRSRWHLFDGLSWSTQDTPSNAYVAPILEGLEIGSFNDGTRQFVGVIDDVRIDACALFPFQLERFVAPRDDSLGDANGLPAIAGEYLLAYQVKGQGLFAGGSRSREKEVLTLVLRQNGGRLTGTAFDILGSPIARLTGAAGNGSFFLTSTADSAVVITLTGTARAKNGSVQLKGTVHLIRKGPTLTGLGKFKAGQIN